MIKEFCIKHLNCIFDLKRTGIIHIFEKNILISIVLMFILMGTVYGECYDFENGTGRGWLDCGDPSGENNSGYWIWSVDEDNKSNHALMANENSCIRRNLTGPGIIVFEWKRFPGSQLFFRIYGKSIKEIRCDSNIWKSEEYLIDETDRTIEWIFVPTTAQGQFGWLDSICITEQYPEDQVDEDQVDEDQVDEDQVDEDQVDEDQDADGFASDKKYRIIETSFYPDDGCLGIAQYYNFSMKVDLMGLQEESPIPIKLQVFDSLSGRWVPDYLDENYIRFLVGHEQYLNYTVNVDNLFEIPFLGDLRYRFVSIRDDQVLKESDRGPRIHSLFRNRNCKECDHNRCCNITVTSSIPNMSFYIDYQINGEDSWHSVGPIMYTAYPNPQTLEWELPVNARCYKIRRE